MTSHCEFITQYGKECTVKKKGAECPEGFFYCKNHLSYKSVKDRIAGAIQGPRKTTTTTTSNIKSKTTPSSLASTKNFNKSKKSSVKLVSDNSSDNISDIFNADQAKQSIFKILGNNDNSNNTDKNNNSNDLDDDPINILKNILNDEQDTETLSKKQLNSKKMVERAMQQKNQTDDNDDDEDQESIPERKVSRLSVASLLESSYWITMTVVEQRSLKLKGLNENLRSNEALLDNLALAFKEILLFMGLEEDLGVESPCMIVLIATGQVIINTLILNGGLDDLISKFFKKKEGEENIQEERSSRIIIDNQKYADIF